MIRQFLLGLFSIVAIAALASGCGQQHITSSSAQPQGVTLRGTVYSFEVISGFAPGPAVPNVLVRISGDSGAYTTTTNAQGEYTFTGLPDGSYFVTATAEGYSSYAIWSDAVNNWPAVVKSISVKAADKTVASRDIYIFDYPIITGFTPAPGSVIATGQVFTITFDEPMDIASVRIDLVPQGLRAAAAGDTVQANLTWSADSREVTVTPNGSLNPNAVYRLQLMPPAGFPTGNDPPYDSKGNPIYYGAWLGIAIFDEAVHYYADYKTAAGGVPGVPSALQVTVNDKPTPEVSFADVFNSANKIKLTWSPALTGSVTGYKIYAARSGSILNYVPLEEDASTATSTADNYFTSDISKLIKALYGSGAQVDPVATQNYPMVNETVYFKAVAYNGDGESGGGVVAVRDAVGPIAGGYVAEPFAGIVDPSFNFYFPPILAAEKDRIYIITDEPLDTATIAASNFSLDGGLTVLSAALMINCTGGCAIEIKASGNLNGRTLTMSTGIKDLSGNSAGTASNTWGPLVVP
jgi:hypothetical protein